MWASLTLFIPFTLFADISALYLSWYDDPTTTMTIQWHTPEEEYGNTIYIKGFDDNWSKIDGEHTRLKSLLIHKVSLTSLTPDTEYSFRIGNHSKIYHFQTAPDTLEEPLHFVIGGDVYENIKRFRRMSKTVLEHQPRFIVLGGNIAYALSAPPFKASAMRRWLAFFKDWTESMISESGYIIPFVVTPGNHDIAPDKYELFFTFFAFPKKQLYRTLEFGDYLTLILLDTGHFQPIEGRQTHWLEKTLAAHAHVPYRFAVYHEAGYPSYYPYYGTIPKKIRKYWAPLFEKYHLTAAFENHNQAYKRTHPIKANQVDADGVIYIGDGSWGATPRRTKDLWFLAERQKKNSVLIVELTPQEATVQAIDLLNNKLDKVSLHPINK